MDKDIKKLGKFLARKIEEAKEEILAALEEEPEDDLDEDIDEEFEEDEDLDEEPEEDDDEEKGKEIVILVRNRNGTGSFK